MLGIAGAVVAGWLGHLVRWYEPGEGAGFVAAVVGAFIILAHLPDRRGPPSTLIADAVQETAIAPRDRCALDMNDCQESCMRTLLAR